MEVFWIVFPAFVSSLLLAVPIAVLVSVLSSLLTITLPIVIVVVPLRLREPCEAEGERNRKDDEL